MTPLFALFASHVAWAMSLSVAPAIADATIEPGVSSEVTFQVMNPTDVPLVVQTKLADWWHDGTDHLTVVAGSTERSATAWTEVLPAQLVLPPHTQGDLTAVLTPPADATGGYYVMLLVAAGRQPEDLDPGATTLGAAVGVHLSVRIEGTGAGELSLDRVDVAPATSTTPLGVTTVARNDGDVHLVVESRTVVLDAAGTVRATLASRPRVVLPGQALPIETDWSGILEPGRYEALVTLASGPGETRSAEQAFVVGPAQP